MENITALNETLMNTAKHFGKFAPRNMEQINVLYNQESGRKFASEYGPEAGLMNGLLESFSNLCEDLRFNAECCALEGTERIAAKLYKLAVEYYKLLMGTWRPTNSNESEPSLNALTHRMAQCADVLYEAATYNALKHCTTMRGVVYGSAIVEIMHALDRCVRKLSAITRSLKTPGYVSNEEMDTIIPYLLGICSILEHVASGWRRANLDYSILIDLIVKINLDR